MLFNSLNFIIVFLPTFLLSYHLADYRFKNVVIFVYSILFYIIGNINNVTNIIILSALTFINYGFCIYINGENDSSRRTLKRYICVLFNVIVIILFKSEILLKTMPIGLSFYTFHFISLLIDVSKNNSEHIGAFEYSQYILYFPKLLSGPITRYDYFKNTYDNKKDLKDCIYKGLFIFTAGLGLKCLLADNIGNVINQITTYGIDSISLGTAWIGMYSYTLKLYFDFAGYSLMAIGIARAMGMNLPDNFNLPFMSNSISEFWRRWHITLGKFFKDYVYIPLGGNFSHNNIIRQCFNIFIVWVLTGLWHGFKINYMLWAMAVCIVIILEKIILDKIYKKLWFVGRIIVLLYIPFTFLIFSIEDINVLRIFISRLVDFNSIYNAREFFIIIKLYWKVLIISLLFITNLPKRIYELVLKNKVMIVICSLVLIILSCYMININAGDVFKYFTF